MKKEIQRRTEIKWNPDGFHFLGPEESAFRRKILEKFHEFFTSKGFAEVKPPSFDFSATFEHHVTDFEKDKILKTRDLAGKELSPSLDLTLQVVKGMAGYSESRKGSSKVYYTGRVFRDISKSNGSRRETLQAGAEILGHSNGNTFKLLLSLIDSLMEILGYKERVTIVLGNMLVVTSILNKFKFSEWEKMQFTHIIYSKDLPALDKFLKDKGLSKAHKDLLSDLLLSFTGSEKICDKLREADSKWKLGLEECLKETRDILSYCKKNLKNLDVCLDFALVRDMEYYTGFLFYGFAGNGSHPLVMGGAYDRLFEKFSGEPKRACGLAFQIDTLEDLLRKEN